MMKRKLSILLLVVLSVVACAGPQTVRQYELGKVTAETILYEARILQNKGQITAQQFDQVRRVYDQLKVAQDIAIDTRKAVIQYNTTDAQAKVMSNVLTISTQLLGLAQSMGIKVN